MRTLLAMVSGAIGWALKALGWTAAFALMAVGVICVAWLTLRPGETSGPEAGARSPAFKEPYVGETFVQRVDDDHPFSQREVEACDGPVRFQAAARTNARSLDSLVWAPFGPEEIGWEIYGPLVAEEIGTRCGYGEPGFAAALAAWQRRKGPRADGVMTPASFEIMRQGLAPEAAVLAGSPGRLSAAAARRDAGDRRRERELWPAGPSASRRAWRLSPDDRRRARRGAGGLPSAERPEDLLRLARSGGR